MEKKHRSNYGEKKYQIISLLEQGFSYKDIAKIVHCSLGTIAFHAKNIGKEFHDKSSNRYDWEAIQRYHDEGHSIRECSKHFGFSKSSWTKSIKNGRVRRTDQSKYILPIESLLVSDRKQTGRGHLKQRLISLGLLVSECAICGITDWMDQPLVLELDHINGKNKDNRLENLRLLCPNCHSQTNTYCGKQKKLNSLLEK